MSNTKVYWGQFRDDASRYVKDDKLPTSVSGAPSAGGPARKTRIATYYGSSFISERGEDGSLHIYHIGQSLLPTDTIGDAKPCGCGSSLDSGRVTAAVIQRRNEEMRRSGVWK